MKSTLRAVLFASGIAASLGLAAAPVDLAVTTIDGKIFDLAGHRGEWVVVNYWATWCGPCIKEMPELNDLDQSRQDVSVLGLAFEETSAEDLKRFVSKRSVQYAIALIDVYAPPKIFEVPKGLPTTHLIGPDGELKQSFIGPVTRADLEKVIAAEAAAQAQ
jgi:thiol-disulfide isomerase/thioredoxin